MVPKRTIALAGAKTGSATLEATKRVYAKAPSVGSTARVRYHLARTDVDVDGLSAAQQRALGELYATADPIAAKAVRRMDGDALDDLTKLDVDAGTRRQLAPTYADLGATKRQQLTSQIDGDAAAASNAGELSPSGVRAALDYACNSPCSIQPPVRSPLAT